MSLQDPNVVNRSRKKRVAIVIANPSTSTTTGWPVGFWWSELSHPYFLLTEKGYEVDVFSPNGGGCEADAISDPRDPSGYSARISSAWVSSPPRTLSAHRAYEKGRARSTSTNSTRFWWPVVRRRCSRSTPPITAAEVRRVLRARENCRRALPRSRHPQVRAPSERPAPR